MKRRKFVKTSAAAAGLMGSLEISPLLAAAEKESPKTGAPLADNRPAEYLNRVQGDPFLPKPPAAGRSYPISPMPLEERVRQEDCAAAGLLQHCPREPGQRGSHLRQWCDEYRVDGRSLLRANPFPPRKPAYAMEEAPGGTQRCGHFFASAANGAGWEKQRSSRSRSSAYE